jgi:hypothetical protein
VRESRVLSFAHAMVAVGLAAGAVVTVGDPSASAQAGVTTLVVCAPGYPGSTAEAQSAMDAFATAIAAAAGWMPGELRAVYFEAEKPGVDRLAAPDAAVVLAPLPFWLKHRSSLRLSPQFQAIEEGGEAAEVWTLVAPAGGVSGPASLAGFEIVTTAGYAPRFVRGSALGAWGDLPADVRIVSSNNVLSAMRRASQGHKVAALLDRASAAAMPTLPFAAKLQTVTKSAPLPVAVLSAVGDRLRPAKLQALLKALRSLDSTPSGRQALAGVRLARFVPADQAALAKARDQFDRAKE